ncbi:MAG: hypothetical protein JOZ91_09695 [Candidatus Eremiobacteraeota bacterium]|nr:hypothetical protein [Candidatus Eremiobacteraeota bacterium]MBV8264460.1 hypothetical protein [Candidatus Eremiobacteraeota bacterium]
MSIGSVGDIPATLASGVLGCVCATDATLDGAAQALENAGIQKESLHVGALDPARAIAAAQRLGVAADITSDDPLAGLVAGGDERTSRLRMDRGGVIGGAIGALAGCALGLGPAGSIVASPQNMPVLANAALYFVIGAIIGSVLGAAFAPQPSTHAGFRLIDGMQEGAYALVAVVPADRHAELRRALDAAGAAGITSV